MARTFAESWPAGVDLNLYAEGFVPDLSAPNIFVRELPEWHTAWKQQHAGNPDAHGRDVGRFGKTDRAKGKPYSYRRDCVRFSHKVAALTDAVLNPAVERRSNDGPNWLIMADADLITHTPVTIEWLRSLVNDPGFYLAWLDRSNWYPECGFVIFREDHPKHVPFMRRFRAAYETNEVFGWPETHDSYVLQRLAEEWERKHAIKTFSLSSKIGKRSSHPFVYSRLAECLDHAKGKFKIEGRTPVGYVKRAESHWGG